MQVIADSARNLLWRLLGALRVRRPLAVALRAPRRRLSLSADPPLVYAIGDVHGCLDQLQRLEADLVADAADSKGPKLIVMLGDYVDRGPRSADVIAHLSGAPPEGFYRVCLSGNHEELMLDVLQGRIGLDEWLTFGGEATLRSYGLDVYHLRHEIGFGTEQIMEEFRRSVPKGHITFLQSLPAVLETPTYFFTHAGARPGVALDDQSEQDLMWIRSPFLDTDCPPFPRIIVHGHSQTLRPALLPHRIGIDTAAYMGGPLSAIGLTNGAQRIIAVR